jgi:methylglutaconyl-CoA hydratase
MHREAMLLVERQDGVARVTLNRPAQRNALDAALARTLSDAFTALGHDPAVRAIVLTGAGAAFCAGADIRWLTGPVSRQEAHRQADGLLEMFRAVDECPCPVVGRIHGAAYGGGVGLISVCDIAVAEEEASFALSELRLGLMPALIAPFLLRKAGAAFLRRFGLSGERFSARVAQRFHLVHDVVPGYLLDKRVEELMQAIGQLAPEAVRHTKALMRRLPMLPEPELWEVCTEANAAARCSAEAQEGLRAFLEKRRPSWASGPAGADTDREQSGSRHAAGK